MNDLLQEYCDSRGLALRVDRAGGVVRGIKILGLHSRNSREYLPDALARAIGLYEGAKVNVNHPKGHPLSPRDYQERIGVIRNVQHRAGEGLFGDFHFNPKHQLAEQLAWDAEHAPENVGFSHNVQAQTSRRGETTMIEEILRVHSVDLVADPATTRGLFESTTRPAIASGAPVASAEGPGTSLHGAAVDDALRSPASDMALAPVALQEQRSDLFEKLCREQAAEISRLRLEVDRSRAAEAAEQRRAAARALLAEYRLPDPDCVDPAVKAIVSDTFVQSLLAAPDESTMRHLVEERSRLVGSARQWGGDPRTHSRRPTSRDQTLLDPHGVANGQSFARAISS